MTRQGTLILLAIAVPVALLLLSCGGVVLLMSRLGDGYEVSDGKVFYRTFDNVNWKIKRTEVEGADPQRLETISWSGGRYASDGTTVFAKGHAIDGADPETFRVLDWRTGYSRDAHHAYWSALRMSDDPDHLRILPAGYAKDRFHVYSGWKAIDGADPETFVVTDVNLGYARDKNHHYNRGRHMEDPNAAASAASDKKTVANPAGNSASHVTADHSDTCNLRLQR